MSSSIVASHFPSPFTTSKLSHIVPNVPLKSSNLIQYLPSPRLSSSASRHCLLRSRIRVRTFSSSSSSSSSSENDNNINSSGSHSGSSNFRSDDNKDGTDHNMHTESVIHDVDEISDNVSSDDEFFFHRYAFGLVSYLFQRFHGNQQVIYGFVEYLMRSLGDNVEFVVKPTLQHGINVGFTWKFQWSKTVFPLGEGLNFYILQTYQGKFLIRNLEMLVEVLPLHIEPIRLRFVAFMMGILHMMEGLNLSQDKMKRVMVALLFMVIVLLFLSPEIY